jgi:UDP-N-acetylglucosamine--dolichyl-phosphate N-acetylglucosaminephosphotransferase
MITLFMVFILSLTLVILLTPLFIKIGGRLNLTGVDIHKPDKPSIPKTGGPALVIGVITGLTVYLFVQGFSTEIIALIYSSLIAALIGLIEDIRGEINPKVKPALLVVAGIPILTLSAYTPRPVLPFIGATRLTRIYPFLVLVSYPVVCNAVNSIDVLNGSISFTSIAFFTAVLIVSGIHGFEYPLTVSVIMLAALVGFTIYNKYPSRVFAGNSGSLFIGAVMVSTAIIGRIEVVAIIALLPHIMNEMHVIFSMRGLKSAKKYNSRPIIIENGLITANPDEKAPITLVRMLSAKIRAREDSLVKSISLLSFYSMMLAILTNILFMR